MMAPPGLAPGNAWWRTLTRRAFVEPTPACLLRYRYAGRWHDQPPVVVAAADGQACLGIIIPTLAPAVGAGSLPQSLVQIRASIQRLLALPNPPQCFVIVAMQDRPQASRRAALLAELEDAWQQSSAGGPPVPLVGLAVSQPSKILALNSCAALLDANRASCLAWFDDDVQVQPACLPALWQAFDPQFAGIYGARKVAVRDSTPFSQLWSRIKNRRERINRYPHGCAMLLTRTAFGQGIPLRYLTDDHYYLFRLLDPQAANPFHLLPVVPDAVVRVPSVNTAGTSLRRAVRNYRNVQRVLADASPAVIRYFLRELHFPGLRRPRSWHEARSPRYWLRLATDAVRRGCWGVCRAEVLLRGLAGRPRRSVWFSAPPPMSMAARTEPMRE